VTFRISRKSSIVFSSILIALGFGAVAAVAQTASDWNFNNEYFRAALSERSKYKAEGEHLTVSIGEVLVEPTETMTLHSPHAETHVSKKSLVYERLDKNSDHIFVLLGHATVHVGHHSTSLKSGDEVVVTANEPTTADLVGDEIGRRRLRLIKASNGYTVASTEFSLVHAIEREPLLYSLVHSNSATSRAIKMRLIKMAAVLNFVTSRHGPYTTNVR
jgi:mannose-6-phosphate isomerase-like protein (cupin superfamily)